MPDLRRSPSHTPLRAFNPAQLSASHASKQESQEELAAAFSCPVHQLSRLLWLWMGLLATADFHFSGLPIHKNMLSSANESVSSLSFTRFLSPITYEALLKYS